MGGAYSNPGAGPFPQDGLIPFLKPLYVYSWAVGLVVYSWAVGLVVYSWAVGLVVYSWAVGLVVYSWAVGLVVGFLTSLGLTLTAPSRQTSATPAATTV